MLNLLNLGKGFIKGEPLTFRAIVLAIIAAGASQLHIVLDPTEFWVAAAPLVTALVTRHKVTPVAK